MIFKKTLTMRLASLVTMLVLVAGTPVPAFVAYAQEAPAEESAPSTPSDTPSDPAPAQEASPSPDTSSDTSDSSTDTGADTDTNTTGDGGAGGAGGEGDGGTGAGSGDGGAGGAGAEGGGTTEGAGDPGAGGDGGAGGESNAGGTAGDGGVGGDGGVTGPVDEGTGTETGDGGDGGAGGGGAEGGAGGAGGDGGTTAPGTGDSGTGGDGGQGGDATGESTTAGDGGNGGGGGGGGSVLGASDGASTEIGTGNASAESVGINTANATDLNTGTSTANASTTMSVSDLFTATSTASSTATTGEITAEDDDGILARLGRANALAILINIFNIAIKDSVGSILFLKNPIGDALNFTNQFASIFGSLAGASGECSFMGCSSEEATFRFLGDSISEVNNEAISRVKTGGFDGSSQGGTVDVKTGDGDAMSVIWNLGHLTLANSRYLVILMANQGDLNGDVLLPDGDFFKKLSSVAKISLGSSYVATSTVDVANTADSTAKSGDNSAIGDETSIDTGNADAHSSAGTMANMIGAPMCFIINIGGEWNGEVKRLPDTFTHESATFGEIICGTGGGEDRGGDREKMDIERTDYARIVNRAISEAITGDVHGEALKVALETGDASAFSHIMNLIKNDIIGQDWIFANFAISGDWNGDLQFGPEPGETDILTEIANQVQKGSSWNTQQASGADITFTKNAGVVAVASPAQVDYEIVVDNNGGEAHQVVVNDTMTGPNGGVIGKQMWNLGTVAAGESVTIKYTIDFAEDAEAGYYTNTATISGQGDIAEGQSTLTAKDVIEILPKGEQPAGQCEPLLTEYIRPYRANSPAQVKVLQEFLNLNEGESLTTSGVFDSKTQAAVKRFQLKYAADILTPWGITTPTGNVYYTTQKKVNSIHCQDDTKFELSVAQQSEIQSFRARLFAAPKVNVGDLLKIFDVGQKKGAPTAKGPLLMPPPAMPSIFAPVSNSKDTKPVSMMSLPTSLFKNWLLSAIPQVEAAER